MGNLYHDGMRQLQDDFRASTDTARQARLALEAAGLNDAWLNKPKVFELSGLAIQQRPDNGEPQAVETVRSAVRNAFAGHGAVVRTELEVLERAFGRVPLVLAMRAEAERLLALDRARLDRYWFR